MVLLSWSWRRSQEPSLRWPLRSFHRGKASLGSQGGHPESRRAIFRSHAVMSATVILQPVTVTCSDASGVKESLVCDREGQCTGHSVSHRPGRGTQRSAGPVPSFYRGGQWAWGEVCDVAVAVFCGWQWGQGWNLGLSLCARVFPTVPPYPLPDI